MMLEEALIDEVLDRVQVGMRRWREDSANPTTSTAVETAELQWSSNDSGSSLPAREAAAHTGNPRRVG
jgi:hypothetical protein